MGEEGAPEMVATRRARVVEMAKVFMMDTWRKLGWTMEILILFLYLGINFWERLRCVMKRNK